MALKVTPIGVLGILDLGVWKRDCEKLRSVVIPPKSAPVSPNAPPPLPPNTLQGNVSGGLPGARLLSLIPSGATGAPEEATVNQRLTQMIPGFSGAFQAQLVAEGFAEACAGDDKTQKVSWFYYIKLAVRGSASTGVLAGGGSFALSLGPFGPGDEESCPCVAGAEPQLAAIPSPADTAVAALIANTAVVASAAAGPLLDKSQDGVLISSETPDDPAVNACSETPFKMDVRTIDGELWGKLSNIPG